MKFSIQLHAVVSIALFTAQWVLALAQKEHGFRHEVLDDLHQRHVPKSHESMKVNTTTIERCSFPSTAVTALTTILPSPGAAPVEVFNQSQIVTSYIPEATWCFGPPMGLVPTATLHGPPYLNASTLYATIEYGTGHCETVYVSTATTVCATTLTGLASKITVTDCDQEITFSSECSFTLETPTPTSYNLTALITPAPTVRRLMTYWLAPWHGLTLGETPSEVDIKVCTVLNGEEQECHRYQEVWEVFVVTQTVTTQWPVRVETTVSGPGTLMAGSLQAYLTDTVVFVDLSTTLLLETEIEIETISKTQKPAKRPDPQLEPTATVYLTKEFRYRSTAIPEPITTLRLTSTIVQQGGTITRTRVRPLPSLMDVVRDF